MGRFCECGAVINIKGNYNSFPTRLNNEIINEHLKTKKHLLFEEDLKKKKIASRQQFDSSLGFLLKNLKFGGAYRKKVEIQLLEKSLDREVVAINNEILEIKENIDSLEKINKQLKGSSKQLSLNKKLLSSFQNQLSSKDRELKRIKSYRDFINDSKELHEEQERKEKQEWEEKKKKKKKKEEKKGVHIEKLTKTYDEVLDTYSSHIKSELVNHSAPEVKTNISDDEKGNAIIQFSVTPSPFIDRILKQTNYIPILLDLYKKNRYQALKLQVKVYILLYDKNDTEQTEKHTPITIFNIPYFLNSEDKFDAKTINYNIINILNSKLYSAFDKSGCSIKSIPMIEFIVDKTSLPAITGSPISIPDYILKKKAVKNLPTDNCFEDSITYLLNEDGLRRKNYKDLHRLLKEEQLLIRPKHIPKPFLFSLEESLKDQTFNILRDIEKTNNISLYIYAEADDEEEKIKCVFASKSKAQKINLLHLTDDNISHILPITNINHLLGVSKDDPRYYKRRTSNEGAFYCKTCMKNFPTKAKYNLHANNCIDEANSGQRLIFPQNRFAAKDKKDKTASKQFDKYQETMHPIAVCYYDFESTMNTMDDEVLRRNEKNKKNKKKNVVTTDFLAKHVPNSCCYTFVSPYLSDQNYCKMIDINVKDCVKEFLRDLLRKYTYFQEKIHHSHEIDMSESDIHKFQAENNCCICGTNFITDEKDKLFQTMRKVKHHDHFKEKNNYIGAAHNSCNRKAKKNGIIPVICHNASKYDLKFIVTASNDVVNEPEFKSLDIKADPMCKSSEEAITLKLGIFKFLDSYKMQQESLEKIVKSQKSKDYPFEITKKYLRQLYPNNTDEDFKVAMQKNAYPYTYITSIEKLLEPQLPPLEEFNKNNSKKYKQEDIDHANKVFSLFKCKDIHDYHKLYLYQDVFLLADVHENFRRVCIQRNNLDPVNFVSAPSLSDSSAYLKGKQSYLKFRGVKLINNIDVYNAIQASIKGGITQVVQRYTKANNKYCKDYDKTKPTCYVLSFDINQEYPTVMAGKLPMDCGRFLTEEELRSFKKNWRSISTDGNTNYMVCFDAHVNDSLHDKFSDLPLLPEKKKSLPVSEYNRIVYSELDEKNDEKTMKLVCDLTPKVKYVDFLNTMQYVDKMQYTIDEIHYALAFEQSEYFRDYINENVKERNKAKKDGDEYLDGFYKRMNNSLFGKQMMNEANFERTELVINNEKKLRRLINKPNFVSSSRLKKGTYIIQLRKEKVTIKTPKIVGSFILALSKIILQKFYYDVLQQDSFESTKDPKSYFDNVKLIYMDTDSLYVALYPRSGDDIKDWINGKSDILDLSHLSLYSDLGSNKNQGKLGLMKIEEDNIEEMIALRPKMYVKKLLTGQVETKVKGISGKNELTFQEFKDCLEHTSNLIDNKEYDKKKVLQNKKCFGIVSKDFAPFSVSIDKISLSALDDKRHVLIRDEYNEDEKKKYSINGATSLAHGHNRLRQPIATIARSDSDDSGMKEK